jgi:sugar phosphate isomerase/epimerase
LIIIKVSKGGRFCPPVIFHFGDNIGDDVNLLKDIRDVIAVNALEKDSLKKAAEHGFGLEITEYIASTVEYTNDEIKEKRGFVHEQMKQMSGFSKFSSPKFSSHATIINESVLKNLPDDELLNIYNDSYHNADFHNINKIVYHSNYFSQSETHAAYLKRQIPFWKRFLQDKPSAVKIYIENLADETPDLLAQLCDAVNDSRFKICLDTGHACSNSQIAVTGWIKQLGKRIEHVHLHNNDGISDTHWALGKGILNDKEIIEHLLEYTSSDMIVLECDFEESLLWLQQNDFM